MTCSLPLGAGVSAALLCLTSAPVEDWHHLPSKQRYRIYPLQDSYVSCLSTSLSPFVHSTHTPFIERVPYQPVFSAIELPHTSTHTATVGGTLLSICGNLHLEDLVRTAVLAALGAVVSFIVSVSLNFLLRKWKNQSLAARKPPRNI